jgi:hypothetical protein
MKPSDLIKIYPWNSIFQKSEHETTACCIARYLYENGNEFRIVSFDEYKESQPNADEKRFLEVIKYFKSEDTIRLFSKDWDL